MVVPTYDIIKGKQIYFDLSTPTKTILTFDGISSFRRNYGNANWGNMEQIGFQALEFGDTIGFSTNNIGVSSKESAILNA